MKKYMMISSLLLSFAAVSSPATAAPLTAAPNASPDSIVEKTQRFHRDCKWVNNRWTYRRGDKMLVCRPHRPSGAGWRWHREGGREGWYDSRRRAWHYQF